MNIEERTGKVEKRVNTMEQALQILTELIVSHDERLVKSLNSDEDLNAKISALIDAQIRSEDKLQTLAAAQARSEGKLQTLAEAQVKSEDKLQQLIELVGKAHLRIDRLES